MIKTPGPIRTVFLLIGLLLLGTTARADSHEVITIGILSFLSEAETEERWAPTARALSEAVDGHAFRFRPYNYPDLNRAVANREVDFVFTNPEHHIFLMMEHGLAAFATLKTYSGGLPLDHFGGVILVRADRADLLELRDVRRKRVAAVSGQSLGGYLAQRGALMDAGIDIRRDTSSLTFTGMPHSNVVFEVLEGRADVGTVRTGVLENLAERGEIDLADIRVLNRQPTELFPQLLSTPLYPEWPISAMRGVPDELVKQVAVALLSIEPDDPAARAGGYFGFSPPADYSPVAALMEQLRVGPYAEAHRFDWRDIYRKYSSTIIGAMAVSLVLAILIMLHGFRINRRLNALVQTEKELGAQLRLVNHDLERRILEREQAQRALKRSEQRLSILFDSMQDQVFVIDRRGRFTEFFQPVGDNRLVKDATDCIGRPHEAVFPYRVGTELQKAMAAIDQGARARSFEYALEDETGTHWFMAQISPVRDPEQDAVSYLVVVRDITERKQVEERLRLDASVFHHAHEGILITDAKGEIIEANEAFARMTGYSRGEMIGRNPRFLQSGRQDKAFYQRMWKSLLDKGAWHGEIWNRRRDGEIYAQLAHISTVRDDRGALTHFVGLFSDITPLKETERQLKNMAYHDALTQLPNRTLLAEQMDKAMRHARDVGLQLAVAYLDLDGFKPVNDTLGHEKGDGLLIDVADRLRKCVRGMDTVARLGGDEFIVLFNEIDSMEGCERAVNRILEAMEAPFEIDGQAVRISASIGVTLFPSDDSDADTLMRHADQAMYRAKQAGRNRFHLFDPEHDRQQKAHNAALGRIATGLANREFELFFQPKVDMAEGRVAGAEALIRWRHPERGLVSPGEFLPVVDGSELSVKLGDWVIAEALRLMRKWQHDGIDLPVSVNISARHLEHPEFSKRLEIMLGAVPDYRPGMLELEILETAALMNVERISQLIRDCAEMGVLFSLDDFGTGYSSLTYLKRLPAQTLKIDQSFVRGMLDDPEDMAIVEGVVGLARAFDRCVIAEGAETPRHCRLLLQMGCFMAQGYGIARPMPAGDFPQWVRQFTPDPLWKNDETVVDEQ